jgi:hypothetical protein
MKTTTQIIIFLSLLIIALSTAGYYLIKDYQFQKSEVERQKTNVEVLNKNFKSYKTALGNSAAKVEALNYKISEMQEYEAALTQTIKELKLKPKNVVSVAEIGTQTTATIKTVIQYVDSAKCLNYEDRFNTISGCFKGDSIDLKIETRDSLTTIVSKIPKHRFLWWSWGVKAIQLDIKAQNPDTKFTYLKYIELKK